MGKAVLHLYIDKEVSDEAKKIFNGRGKNSLSQEFENWLKIRLNMNNELREDINPELEIAKHKAEIENLTALAEKQNDKELKEKEKDMLIDSIVDEMIKYKEKADMDKSGHGLMGDYSYSAQMESRIPGVQYLFQNKFHINLNKLEAKELLLKKFKEKGIEIA